MYSNRRKMEILPFQEFSRAIAESDGVNDDAYEDASRHYMKNGRS